jgi:hypothetical protein
MGMVLSQSVLSLLETCDKADLVSFPLVTKLEIGIEGLTHIIVETLAELISTRRTSCAVEFQHILLKVRDVTRYPNVDDRRLLLKNAIFEVTNFQISNFRSSESI